MNKAPLLRISIVRGVKSQYFILGPFRLANAMLIYVGPFLIQWRMPRVERATNRFGRR